MPVDASIGLGCRLFWSLDGTAYTELTDIVTLGPPDDAKREQIDITSLTPTNYRREYLPGLYGTTVFTFRQYYSAARITTLKPHRDSGAILYWRYTYDDNATPADASRFEWRGSLNQYRPDGAEVTKPNHIDGEVQVTGDVTFTEATP